MEPKKNKYLKKALAYSLVALMISLMVLALSYHRLQSIQLQVNTATSSRAILKIVPRPPGETSFWRYIQRYLGL